MARAPCGTEPNTVCYYASQTGETEHFHCLSLSLATPSPDVELGQHGGLAHIDAEQVFRAVLPCLGMEGWRRLQTG
ncbi:hypothetical protein UPYG_G00157900 [Umbra pygmaea]|uniref:Uncharacterized protein n=1 Tax=Umbra pygmaea TaxID=75934 RepID=A0ABD0WYN0_UMBPY